MNLIMHTLKYYYSIPYLFIIIDIDCQKHRSTLSNGKNRREENSAERIFNRVGNEIK